VDGLRGLALAAVIVTHVYYIRPESYQLGFPSTYLFPHFPLGLTMFFALSGFLLYLPFASAIMRERPLPDTRRYLRNRALRILPAYWVILGLAVVLGWATVRESPDSLGLGRIDDPGVLLATALFLENYFPSTLLGGISPSWSLCIEVVFYLCLPLLGLLAEKVAARGSGRRHMRMAALVPVLLLVLIALSGKLAALAVPAPPGSHGWGGDWHSVIARSFWTHSDLIAFGMAVAVLWVDRADGLLRLPRWWGKAVAALFVSIAVVAGALFENEISHQRIGEQEVEGLWTSAVAALDNRLIASNLVYDSLMGVACALLLALVVLPALDGGPRSMMVAVLESKPLVAVGATSYSMFLWHAPVIAALNAAGLAFDGRVGLLLHLAVVGAGAGALTALTYRFVEAPALRRKAARKPLPATQVQAAP
jgi:peptidoglycan/LPS O-acetylase OafA/YrhL